MGFINFLIQFLLLSLDRCNLRIVTETLFFMGNKKTVIRETRTMKCKGNLSIQCVLYISDILHYKQVYSCLQPHTPIHLPARLPRVCVQHVLFIFLTWDDAHSSAMLIYTDWSMLSTCSVLLASKASCWGAPQITPSQETILNSLYVSLSFPAGSFPTATIWKATLIYRKHLLLKKSLFFPSPTHPKRVCHRADSKLFQLACQTDHKQPRPMGIQRSLTRWERTLYFELCLKGDRTYLLRKKGICGKAYRLFYCVHPSSCAPRPSP